MIENEHQTICLISRYLLESDVVLERFVQVSFIEEPSSSVQQTPVKKITLHSGLYNTYFNKDFWTYVLFSYSKHRNGCLMFVNKNKLLYAMPQCAVWQVHSCISNKLQSHILEAIFFFPKYNKGHPLCLSYCKDNTATHTHVNTCTSIYGWKTSAF